MPADAKKFLEKILNIESNPLWYKNFEENIPSANGKVTYWVMRCHREILAVIPTIIERSRTGCRLLSLSNYYTSLFSLALAPELSPTDLIHLFRGIRKKLPDLNSIQFEPLDPLASGFLLLQDALQQAGFPSSRYFRFGNWYTPTPGSYAAYLKDRNANFRSNIKRAEKRLLEAGGRFEVITSSEELTRGLTAYWKVYRASWKQEEPHPQFIDGLATWAASIGSLRLGLIWIDSEPIAAQIWLVAHGRAEIFKVSYDETRKALSPGTTLTAKLVEYTLDIDQVAEVDFLIGDDEYKRNWMSDRRERWGLQAFNIRRPIALAGYLRALLGPAVRQLVRRALSLLRGRSSNPA